MFSSWNSMRTLDAIRSYPEFPVGSRTWDERAYHPDAKGVVRPISELWPNGKAPWALALVIGLVQKMGCSPVSGSLRLAWNEDRQLRLALGENEG